MNTIIKMKKHPIDDLFAKKLAEHRQEPSQKAFEKFQARLGDRQQKRRGGFFLANRNWGYYAAAAGIVAVLTIGVFSQRNATIKTVVASTSVPKKVNQNINSISKDTDNQLVATNNVLRKSNNSNFLQPEKIILKEVKTLPIINNETSVAKLENKPTGGVPQVAQNVIIDDSPEEQTSVAVNPIFETTPIEKIEEKITETFKNPVDESIVLVLEPEQIEKEIIPSINQDSETPLAEAKILGAEKEENAKSFIAKLYGEYKHFKYGEKVDLKKLGVKDVLARVDDSVLKEDITDVRDFVQRKVGRLQKRD